MCHAKSDLLTFAQQPIRREITALLFSDEKFLIQVKEEKKKDSRWNETKDFLTKILNVRMWNV